MSKKTKTPKTFPPLVTPELQARMDTAIDRALNPPPPPLEFRGFTPIKDRVRRALQAMTLIVAASSSSNDELSDNEIHESVEAAALKARDELYWLSRLPDVVGNLPAPDPSEQLAQIGKEDADDAEMDAFCRERMREMLDGAKAVTR